jgi:hypothetical protein
MNRIFKIGALPNYFKGSFADVSFEVINQFDIYNKVDCIIQDLDTGKKILQLNEKSDPITETKKFVTYINKNSDYDVTIIQERNIKKFVLDIIREIKSNNRKNKVVKNEFPIKKKVTPILKKGSQAAKNKMQLVRAAKQSGKSNIELDKKRQALPVGKRISPKGNTYYEYRSNHSDKGVLLGVGSVFDIKVINDIDDLKKQYYKLAKKYHPDMGGSTIQFQQLQKDYDDLFNKLLKGSSLNNEQKDNEIVIDKAIREIIDALINYDQLIIEVIGKWLWVSGTTFPLRTILSSVGLEYIKKAGKSYWVYKGSESKGRGKMTMDEIKKKYGSQSFDSKGNKKIGSMMKLTPIQKRKLINAFNRLKTGLNKRPI